MKVIMRAGTGYGMPLRLVLESPELSAAHCKLIYKRSPAGSTPIARSFSAKERKQFDVGFIILDRVERDNYILEFVRPISFKVQRDRTSHMFYASFDPLGILVFTPNKDDLLTEIEDEIFLIWDEYVCEPDEGLTKGARLIKQEMLEIANFRESYFAEAEAGSGERVNF